LTCDGAWPCLETIGGVQYRAFRYQATAHAPCSCPTWSYTVQLLPTCGASTVNYIAFSSPPGASLSVNKVTKCPELDPCNDTDHDLWKLNPTLNCSEGGTLTFTLYTPLSAGVSCGNPTWIRVSSGCFPKTLPPGDVCTSEWALRGPGCENLLTDVGSFQIGTWDITRDICTGEPVLIESGGEAVAAVKGWLCDDGCDPILSGVKSTANPTGCVCYQATNIGPWSTGCLFKLNPDRYGYGGSLYTR
jgi:hypothetical protein